MTRGSTRTRRGGAVTAIDEYRSYIEAHAPSQVPRRLAEAAITELEATLETCLTNTENALAADQQRIGELQDQFDECKRRRERDREKLERAEAGLQTIKALLDEMEQREARRCGTCALWQEWKPGLWDCAVDWCGYSTNPETFGCTRWEQRREG